MSQTVTKQNAKRTYKCNVCNCEALPHTEMLGTPVVEFVCYIIGFAMCGIPIPGIMYSIWRRSNLNISCSNCGADNNLVPIIKKF